MSTCTYRRARTQSKAATARSTRTTEIAVVLLVLVTLFAVAWLSGRGVTASGRVRQVRVESGDTLWSLASSNPLPGKTTAETVRVLMELNDIEGPMLVAGSVIQVPSTDDDSSSTLAMR